MTASIAGMIGTWSSCGASTPTNAARVLRQLRSVCSTRSPRTQPRWRNSIASGCGARRSSSASSSSSSLLAGRERGRELEQERAELAGLVERLHGLAACASISPPPARRELHAAARARPRRRRAGRAAASPSLAAWRESSRCSFTSKTKSSGRDLGPARRRCPLGHRVEARVHLHGLEALARTSARRSRAGMPCGYHSSTKPGSAQLEVPTVSCPAIGADRSGSESVVDVAEKQNRRAPMCRSGPDSDVAPEQPLSDRSSAGFDPARSCA